MCCNPGLYLQRQLNYTQYLVAILPDIVPNAQNKTLQKWKLDSNPRHNPEYVCLTIFLEHETNRQRWKQVFKNTGTLSNVVKL